MSNQPKKLSKSQRIYVNRTLNFAKVQAIGYDMDHTLAIYNRPTFEKLAFEETLKKLIIEGYPEELLSVKFDPSYVQRGLLVDKHRGNLLKVDCHKYVKRGFHGKRKLTKEERSQFYNSQNFKANAFISVDTFFALSEVQLFIEIVEYMSNNPGIIQKNFTDIYDDIKKNIDLSHRDNSIKNKVLANIENYIIKDKFLATTLQRQLQAGKVIFLMTNSHWEYTNAVMSYILDGTSEALTKWRDYFQYVIVGSGKPGFFTGSQPFFEVMSDSGLLKIHQGPLSSEAVYHGGNANTFEKLTSLRGDEILYIGDHIYGDIKSSKDLHGWRTALIVDELEDELDKIKEQLPVKRTIDELLIEKEGKEEEYQRVKSKSNYFENQIFKAKKQGDKKKIQKLQTELDKVTVTENNLHDEVYRLQNLIKEKVKNREYAIHPLWGETMYAGLERSRFADQISNYSCVYMSRVANLRFYNQTKKFLAFKEMMPHEI